MKVSAIFDIGKTNKKFFLFDKNYNQVYEEYCRFEEVEDDDGFPCDDLPRIEEWIKDTFHHTLQDQKYEIKSLNFSTYGASLVHIDEHYRPVTPLYNYLKPLPDKILNTFYKEYGDELTIASETASPSLGMLNAGLQLYWLKHTKPEVFRKIRWSLYFPQYLSLLFSGTPNNEYTGLGCHTALWNFKEQDYHRWVYAEGIDKKFPPIRNTGESTSKNYGGHIVKIGLGIHDSSSALLPYIKADKNSFLLISTGTWSISLNPFNHEPLTREDLQNDCLNFLSIDGKPVRASRLFLGAEYRFQVKQLHKHFNKEYGYHRELVFDTKTHIGLTENYQHFFRFEQIRRNFKQPDSTNLSGFPTFEIAHHQLMLELMELQVQSIKNAIGGSKIISIYVDGGFADNRIFVKLLSLTFPQYKLRTTRSPLGSALGAIMAISNPQLNKKFLKKKYVMKKHQTSSI